MVTEAHISHVVPESPADCAGFSSGCIITAVDGQPLRDILDWQWLSAEENMKISYRDSDGEEGTTELSRDWEEEWGFEFSEIIFDELKLCRNACSFCFMRQLPEDARPPLVLRDDDFRLSFLQGTFVTLTNLSLEDEKRIIDQRISPLRVSLHAVTPEIREALMGKHAQHGMRACERLLSSGIEMHMQIVLLPGINDGQELIKTLRWAYQFPNIVNVGIVPVGFTKHQSIFEKSFNEKEDARGVIEAIVPLQQRAHSERGYDWVYVSDEFYRNAYPDDLLDHLPQAQHYGEFEMFEDGVGIIRSFVDDWYASSDQIIKLADHLLAQHKRVFLVIGFAQKEFLAPLINQSALRDLLIPLPVKNDYFGGNVDVTGLLCGQDIIASLKHVSGADLIVIPSIVFNCDGQTLDDMTLKDIQKGADVPVEMVSCNASEYLVEMQHYFNDLRK